MTDEKMLYLVRHAKSGWMDSCQRDFDRILDEQGNRDAAEMGHRLQQNGIRPDLVICSPACRAVQTLEHLAPCMNIPIVDVLYNKSIYEAATSTLLEIIQKLDDPVDSAMMIGHNPAMSWLINHLTSEHISNMPTCSIATISIPSNHWKDAGTASSRLLDFDFPE
ncbi:MAG: histidine phosphatase family protein [Pontiella sp.]